MIPVAEALDKVLALVAPLPAETVPLRAGLGRVLAAPVRATLTQPPFDASAMDGYWLAAADHRPGARLHVAGEAAAGRGYAGPLAPGQAVRIFTGAPCPAPGGVVLLQEDVTREGDTITLPSALSQADNIRPRGQDFAEGMEYFPRAPLTARDLGLIAAMNVATLSVHRRPVVALIATGDELVMPGEVPGPDQILSSNSFVLAALAEEAGAEVRMLPIARDTEDSLATANQNCINCHGDAKSLAVRLAPRLVHKEINPHQSHLVEIDCVTCHRGHAAAEAYCQQCHAFDMPMPPRAKK